jgi:hypothetical protein
VSNPTPKLIPTSGGGYEVHLYGTIIGHVGRGEGKWHATLGDQDLGEHDTRREAVEAIEDVYFT